MGRGKEAKAKERRRSRKDEQSGIRSGTPECAPLRAPGQFTLIHHREHAKGTAAAHSITMSTAPRMPGHSESPFFRDSPSNQSHRDGVTGRSPETRGESLGGGKRRLNPLKSWSSILWPRNSRNSTKAGLSSMLPNSSSSDV